MNLRNDDLLRNVVTFNFTKKELTTRYNKHVATTFSGYAYCNLVDSEEREHEFKSLNFVLNYNPQNETIDFVLYDSDVKMIPNDEGFLEMYQRVLSQNEQYSKEQIIQAKDEMCDLKSYPYILDNIKKMNKASDEELQSLFINWTHYNEIDD